MADDSVPLDVGVEQVAELFQNQRNRPFKGWSSRYLLKSDPGRYSDYAGGGGRDKLDVRPPRGWAWAHGDKGWEVDLTYTQCDLEGWTYATSFRDFTSSNLGLPAPAEHGTRVRRRRFIRRRVVIEDEHYDEDGSEDGGSAVSVFSRRGRSLGGGSASSRGSRGSRMQASRASVGFALAALEEQSSVKSVTVEVVIHGESFVLTAGPNDRVAWLQEEAMARFSREHNFATHVVQVVETYTQDIFQYTPEVGLGEEVDAGVQPLDPQSLVSEALSARDGKLIRPAPMEDGLGHGVPDVRVWGRLQATVVVPPGPLGVVLDGEIADRPVVLVVQGQAGPVTMTTPASTPPPASATATPSPPSTSRSTGPKVSRKDRMKRLLLGLAMKEFPQEMDGPERRPVGSGASPQPDTGGGGAAKGGFFGSTVGPSASREVSPSGRGRAVVSPLLSATDSATVRPGMLLTSVAARSGQGVSQDPVDTIGMGVKEAIETLVRYQHLHRSITFLDPPPGVTSGRGLDEGGGAASTGVTCPFAVSVTVVEAAGIKRSELFNADPFAWVRLGGTSQKTKVRKSTSRPLWDETFRFMVLSLERSMLVQLWDADEIGADVLLGEATVHLKSFPVNHPFMDDNLVLDSWYKLEGSSNAGNVRLKVRIDQQLRVAIHRKKVDSAARLLQGAMRSFVLRRQTVGRRKSGAPPLPPRSSRGSSFSAPGADAGEAVFAAADAAAAAVANVSQGRGAGGGNKATAGGKSGVSRKPSRKSMAGAVGGAWEASGAHSASTLADVFPAEDVDTDESSGRNGTFVPVKLSRESAVGVGRGTFGGGAANGVSPLVVKFLEGPGLERFGGGSLFRKNSTSTTGGRRSTLTCVGSDRRSSNSVRFLDDGRRSTVGGWGEHDEAARPGTSVCKDCLSDVASLLALAMTPARAAKTVMEDATHLRYPTSLAESPPPLAVTAFPAPRGGFGPLTVSSFAAFGSLCGENWADQAAPVLVAPSSDSAAAVAVAAGEVWEKASRGNGVANSSTGIAGGVVSGVLGGVVGTGGGSAAGVAPFVGKASVTVVLNGGGYISLIPGEEFQYWRWASALLLAVSGGPASMKGIGNVGEDSESFRGVVREVKTSFPGGNAEKIADSLCTLRSGAGKLSWSSTVRGQAYELPLSSAKGVVLSNAHTPACKFLFTVTVVSGCLEGITDSGASRFAVSEAEALSPGGGARICCLSHRVAYQDTQIGESFIPFASLTSGKDYTETLDISGNLRRLRLTLHSARGLVSSDVTGVTDPYCVVIPVRLDGTEVTSERGETSWQRSGLLRRDEWEETFELCRWCAPEEVKGIKIFIMDRDISRKDETLGEVFIPASMFKESKARRTKTSLRVNPPPPTSKKYSKNFGKYNVLGGRGSMSSASGSTSPKGTRDLGTLCVSMSVIEMDPSELARAGSGGLPPGGVKIRCSLDIADEFSCAWPALLLRHGSPSASGGGPAVDDEDDDDEDDSGGEAGTGVTEAGRVEKWRVSAGFGGLILSPVASGEGAAADSSPFIRIDPTGPADDFLMEVYENQRKRQPWGWGSGRKRHLKPSDPGRFSDSKGENRLHVKLLSQVEVPAGWAWSASEWSVAGRDCPSDKDGWTYGREPTFDALLRDSASGLSKEQKGTCVRRRRWVRPLYRTGVGRSPPRTGHRPGSSRAVPEATVDIPEGLIPFCRAQSDGSVVVLVHENQRYQPGAGWGSSDEDHLLPEDRAPLTGAAGIHPIDDLDDILPSSVGPAFQWEGEVDDHDEIGWNVGPWTYAEKFSDISMDLPRDAPGSDPGSSPKSPPLPPADRSAGVRSRVWWRVMVALEVGRGSIARGTSVSGRSSSRQSSAHLGQPARRKVAHAGGSGGGGSGGGTGGAQGDRVKIPLERLKRAAVVGPNTLIVEVDVEVSCTDKAWSVGDEWQPATLIIGPCDAPRLGSLLVERTATAKARAALGQVVRRARRLTAPPPLPPRPSAKRGDKGSSWAAGGSSGFYESPRGRSVRSDRWASSGNPAVNNNGPSSVSPRRALSHRHASNSRANTSPFGTDQTRDSSPLPQTPPGLASNSASNNPFVAADARGVSPHTRRPSESRSTSTSNNPFLPREGSTSPGTHSMITPAWSPGTSPGRARRGEVPLLEHVVSEAVDLLQNTGRAVAALDDAYNAAYNASAATDGWGAGGHDAAELGEAVLWTLWSRLVRLQAYLRQLLADTPAQDLKLPAAAKRGDWGVLAEHIDAEAAKQRSEIVAEAPEGTRRDSTHRADEDGVEVEARDVGEGSNMEGSMRAVEGLCGALDRRVSEMLLCADTFPESMLRQAVQVLATQCYTKVADEVGRHVTFRYEGLLPLADQQLLVLLDILVNKADIIERTLQPRLDLVGWRAVPPPLLTKAISVPWLLGAYATSIESKLSGLFRNILETNQEAMEFPPEVPEGSEQNEGSSGSKSPLHRRMKRGIVGGGGSRSKDQGASAQPQGFTMWTLHESTEKPLSVVPTTAMTLLDTYVVTVARRFPDDAGVQAVILRAGASALGSLRNIISAHTEASVTSCPERGWDKLLRFLCATANDCWQLVAESVPSIEERHPRAMAEGAEEAYETLKQLWMVLGVSCCRKAARLVLGFMATDELFVLEGMHEVGAEQSLVEIREALEYYCFNFLRPWLQEYFYHKVLVRMCDHIVVWAVQGLVRAAVARRPPLDQGQLLRLRACRDTLSGTLEACSQREASAPDGPGEGGGMYERRLGFLDDIIELLTVPQDELEGVFTGMLQRHIHCQRSVQHALQVVLSLRADGATVPESVSKWADEANWMGGDAVVLSSDTAEIEPFHRVFRRPLSALRADPAPLVAPTVLAQASDAHRRPLPTFGESVSTDEGVAKEGRGGGGGGKGPGGAGGPIGWSTRALGLTGGPSFGAAITGIARNAGGRSSTGSGSGRRRGMRDVMAKFRKGAKSKTNSGELLATTAPGSEAVVMEGVGVTSAEPVTLLQVMILEAEGLRNVAVLRKTDSYVTAHLSSRTGAREARTSVKKNTCHPKWSEPISFRVPSDSLVDIQFHLRVMGKQKLREDICLGHVELPLAGIGKAGDGGGAHGGKWFPLEEGQGKLRIDAELVTRRPSLVV